MIGYANQADIAREAGVSQGTVAYWIRTGVIPAPPHLIGRRRWWTVNEVERIITSLTYRRKSSQIRIMNGYMNQADLARKAGVEQRLVTYWVRAGIIPAPSHLIGRRRCWVINEARQIIESLSNRPKYSRIPIVLKNELAFIQTGPTNQAGLFVGLESMPSNMESGNR